jgi:Ser/Thr protein kinase RdoA (MazF antagonist)
MSSIVQHAPGFSIEDAEKIAVDLFGVDGRCDKLPSERDQNFRLKTKDNRDFVLKIANALESFEALVLQNQVMERLGQSTRLHVDGISGIPRVGKTLDGNTIATVAGRNGQTHFVRLLTYLPGKPFARVKPHDADLLQGLGRFFGHVDHTLQGYDHPSAHRDFHWDLQHASRVVGELIKHIALPEKRDLVAGFLKQFQSHTEPLLADLRKSVIHNDGNDYNILVAPQGMWQNQVSGIIDFGDMVFSHTVNELAIVCAYAMLDKHDPLTAAGQIVKGYHEAFPLTENELAALYDLMCMRLCMSVCHSAHQSSLEPDNDYLRISEEPAWDLLQRLAAIHSHMAEYLFRDACGLMPVARSSQVVQWLEKEKKNVAPVVEADFEKGNMPIFDFSVGSTFPGLGTTSEDLVGMSSRIAAIIRESGANVGIGQYSEARAMYRTSAYETATEGMVERRTIHLGVDLFMPAGSKVTAFYDGKIHSFHNNAVHLDYGPTIILEHTTGEVPFYTLYGHLSLESLEGLEPGQIIQKGEVFAGIGDMDVNGGWSPHLHFQIITDLFGESGNFPGVARPSQRRVWQSLCPNPNLILNLFYIFFDA